jgi:hypothetical protein
VPARRRPGCSSGSGRRGMRPSRPWPRAAVRV